MNWYQDIVFGGLDMLRSRRNMCGMRDLIFMRFVTDAKVTRQDYLQVTQLEISAFPSCMGQTLRVGVSTEAPV